METVHILLASSSANNSENFKSLLVEDKDSLLRYHLDVVQDANEALRALVRNTHDIYILDNVLAGLKVDTSTLLRQANAGGCSSPVLLMTAARDCDMDVIIEDSGAAGYLHKYDDFNARVVKHAIHYALYHFKRLQEIHEQLSCVQRQLSEVNRRLGHK